MPGREKQTIDAFIRRNTGNSYHFEQFLPGYSGPSYPWPDPPAPKPVPSKPHHRKLSPSSQRRHSQPGPPADDGPDLEGIKPLKLRFPSKAWTPEEHQKLVEGLKRFCRDVARLQVRLPCMLLPLQFCWSITITHVPALERLSILSLHALQGGDEC